jgi:fumarate reductase subunit C
VSAESGYTTYHPRWLRRRTSTYWWLERGSYFAFILRELSSIFVAWCVGYLLLLIRAVSRGEAAYQAFLERSAHPLVFLINLVALFFLVFHAVTWFNLAPQAMVVKMGRTQVPGFLIAASNYGAWVAVSAILAWLLLSGT